MTRARTWSLTQRLLVLVLAFVLLVWAATMASVWFGSRHELNELLDAHLAQTAALLATGEVDHDDDEGGRPLQAPTLIRRYQSRVAFQIWHKGRLAARSADAPEVPLASGDAEGLSNRRIEGIEWRVFTTTRSEKGKVKDVIHVAEHVSARRHVLLATMRGLLVPLLLALPLLAAGIWWSVRRAMAPLRTLGSSVAARRPQALDALSEDGVPPEVRPLVHALNGLFERVAEQLASERRFTADAAHELRTPIAAIRMQAQVAQGAGHSVERAQALAATVAGCDRATRLVEQLLQLARLEAESAGGDAAGHAGRADLGAVAAERVRDSQPAAQARGQRIELVRPAQPVPVAMSAPLAAVLLRNLLDNALRYSPDGAQVRVEIAPAATESGASLCIEDSGPGLPDEALARLGERFFRVLGTGQSGSGLGWSIVRRLARLHELTLTVDRSPTLGGLRVQVRWPACAPTVGPGTP